MIEQPTKIGNSTLYNARVLNMSVAKYYGLVKEYCEIVSKARKELEEKRVLEWGEAWSDQPPIEEFNPDSDYDYMSDIPSKEDRENSRIQDELTLYFSVRKHLNQLVLQKLMKDKIQKFGADKR